MSNAITLIWAGGEHPFALSIGRLRALQKACDAGPEQILQRMRAGDWRVDDIIETLRLGLVGGGYEPERDAGPLVIRMAEQHGLLALRAPAFSVLQAALIGDWGEEPEKPMGTETESHNPPESGGSATSTPTEPS